MEFCSPKVWIYESSDEEYLSANEMLEGITPRSGTRHDRRWSYCKIRTLFNPPRPVGRLQHKNIESRKHVTFTLRVCPHFPPSLHWQYKNSMNGKTCRSLIFVSTGLSVAMIFTSQNQNSYSPVHKIHHPHLWQMKSPNSYVPKTRKYQCSR